MWQQPPPPPPPPLLSSPMEAERAPPARAPPPPQALAAAERGEGPPPPPSGAAASTPGGGGAELSLPGILHFIQHEWARFEAEKSRWEAERAELQAQVAFLQGERKGQENVKADLVRRIKMLEYALKQERSKYHKLKFGTELNQGEKKPEPTSEPVSNGPAELLSLENSPFIWKEGRQLLRQYLEEVGYTDTILEMRSKRVRSLLGHCAVELNGAAEASGPGSGPALGATGLNGGESLLVKQIEEQIKRNAGKEATDRIGNTVMEKIPFLRGCEDDDSDEEEDLEGLSLETQRQHKKQRVKLASKPLMPEVEDEDDDEDSEDALSEFHFLGSGENGEGSGDSRRAGDGNELGPRRVKLQGMLADLRDVDGLSPKPSIPSAMTSQPRSHEGSLGFSSDVFIMDTIGGGEVSLGDLADLTVTNDNELSCDLSDSRDAFKKTWNPKFTLRSHYDGIRALVFHHRESALVTASEDGTLKLWNLQKTVAAKKNTALDVEPVYAFRGHRGPVLSVAMGCNSESCYSGGSDARIRCWKIPDLGMDPYDGYDPSVLHTVLGGHTDAVWSLAFSLLRNRLASCSADGTMRIWDPCSGSCLSSYSAESENGSPTSVAFSSTDATRVVVAFQTGRALLYDVEAACPVLAFESRPATGASQINQVVSHPTQSITITAHDDRGIRFLDNRTGKAVHSMVAHLDAVTCLAVDPNGVFLMSGSHDCSLRLWNLDNKTCTQEITAHRKKHEEAIHDVAFHPSKALIASAGADALAKDSWLFRCLLSPARQWCYDGASLTCRDPFPPPLSSGPMPAGQHKGPATAPSSNSELTLTSTATSFFPLISRPPVVFISQLREWKKTHFLPSPPHGPQRGKGSPTDLLQELEEGHLETPPQISASLEKGAALKSPLLGSVGHFFQRFWAGLMPHRLFPKVDKMRHLRGQAVDTSSGPTVGGFRAQERSPLLGPGVPLVLPLLLFFNPF